MRVMLMGIGSFVSWLVFYLNGCYFFFFFLMIRRPPRSTLFPYTRSSDLPALIAVVGHRARVGLRQRIGLVARWLRQRRLDRTAVEPQRHGHASEREQCREHVDDVSADVRTRTHARPSQDEETVPPVGAVQAGALPRPMLRGTEATERGTGSGAP